MSKCLIDNALSGDGANDTLSRTIYLARHGAIQKFWTQKTYIGQTDLPLAIKGHQQAICLAEKFHKIPISAIYTSDLQRCVTTAEYVGRICELPPIYLPQLREIDLGLWEGVPFATIQKNCPEAYAERGHDIINFRPPGGESFMDLTLRVIPILYKIVSISSGDILIVAHAGVNRVILSQAMGSDLKNLFHIPQEYGCLNRIAFCNNRFYLKP
ncbi:MAG: histidine phosphatase family protein [Desulfobacteraceae bacterium]|jgi:probable phosphoglycerate mutase